MSWCSKHIAAGAAAALGAFCSGVGATDLTNCWTDQVAGSVIDVDGRDQLQGAWSVPAAGLSLRLQQGKGPMTILVPGYDLVSAGKICAQITEGDHQARLLFGGRERRMAEQQFPAWDWLFVSTDAIASSLLAGGVQGVFVGDGKVVVGQGFSQSALTDPSKMAAWLIDQPLARREPVVLFIEPKHQQRFFEFFSNNPLPGVFLSFEDPEKVKDVLNNHASIAEFSDQGFPAYICR